MMRYYTYLNVKYGYVNNHAPEVLFQRLICSFRLPIGLGMVAGGEATRDLEHLEDMLPKFGDELRSSVIDDTVWEAMIPNTSRMTRLTVSSLVMALVHDTKCDILVYRSTMVKITSKPFETGRSVIKSRQIDRHGLLGIDKGSNKLYG